MTSTVWIIWLAVTAGTFGVLEGLGVQTRGGSLSETLRRWLGVQPHRPYRRVVVPLFCGGLALLVTWLVAHLLA